MNKTTLNTLRNSVLLMSAGLLAIGCAGNSIKSGKPQQQAIETAEVQPRDTTTTSARSEPAMTPEELSDENPTREKLPLIDIAQHKQPAQRMFHFGFDKVELGEQDKAILEQHAKFLLENPQLIVQIHGHTDHHGPREYNEYLSKRRAEAVAQVLLAQGVKQSQLVMNALADAQPLDGASSPGQNRRVEIEYTELNLVSSE